MSTTLKTLALTLGLTMLAAAPAMAALTGNGLWENGVWQNGIWSNGVFQNGIWQNGWQNGVSMNGLIQNGGQPDTNAVRVIGIELPSEVVVR